MTLYKIINVSPIQEHLYQTRYGGAKQKRCKQGSLDGFFKKQRIDSDAMKFWTKTSESFSSPYWIKLHL